MSAFREEFYKTFDHYGLPADTGNPLTEYGTGLMLMRVLGYTMLDERLLFRWAVDRLTDRPWLYSKKLDVMGDPSPDEVTKDDIFGVMAGSAAVGSDHRNDIVQYGERSGWNFSNTGENYPSAFARPWDVATYKLAAGWKPALWETAALVGQVLFDAFSTKQNDPSSKRLMWLGLMSIQGRSRLVDAAAAIWRVRIRQRYGGMKGVFRAYHGEDHPFTRFCPETL